MAAARATLNCEGINHHHVRQLGGFGFHERTLVLQIFAQRRKSAPQPDAGRPRFRCSARSKARSSLRFRYKRGLMGCSCRKMPQPAPAASPTANHPFARIHQQRGPPQNNHSRLRPARMQLPQKNGNQANRKIVHAVVAHVLKRTLKDPCFFPGARKSPVKDDKFGRPAMPGECGVLPLRKRFFTIGKGLAL